MSGDSLAGGTDRADLNAANDRVQTKHTGAVPPHPREQFAAEDSERAREGDVGATDLGSRSQYPAQNAASLYEVSFFAGPCLQHEIEELAEAIMDLPEFSLVGAGAVGAKVCDDGA